MAIVRLVFKTRISFQARVRDGDGVFFPAVNFLTRVEAEEHERYLIGQKTKGRKSISLDAKNTTLDEYWSVWSKDARIEVSDGWKISQDQMYLDYISPLIGEMKLAQVGAPDIGRIMVRCQELGRSETTRKHIYCLVKKLFTDAVDYYEMLSNSPVKSRFHRPKVHRTERKFLSPDQAWALLDYSKESYLGPPVWVGILAALRVSEIQALRGDGIHLSQRYLLVSSAYNNKTKRMQAYPKQKDWAIVPMCDALWDYLASRGYGPSDFVCPGPGGGMLSYNTFLPALRSLCRKAGVPEITPHELRHTASVLWASNGASDRDLQRLLNHKSQSSTGRYIHRSDDGLARLGRGIRLRVIEGGLENKGDGFSVVHANVHENVHASEQKAVRVDGV